MNECVSVWALFHAISRSPLPPVSWVLAPAKAVYLLRWNSQTASAIGDVMCVCESDPTWFCRAVCQIVILFFDFSTIMNFFVFNCTFIWWTLSWTMFKLIIIRCIWGGYRYADDERERTTETQRKSKVCEREGKALVAVRNYALVLKWIDVFIFHDAKRNESRNDQTKQMKNELTTLHWHSTSVEKRCRSFVLFFSPIFSFLLFLIFLNIRNGSGKIFFCLFWRWHVCSGKATIGLYRRGEIFRIFWFAHFFFFY